MASGGVFLHRYAEVEAALRSADLVVPGMETPHDSAHTVVRRSVRHSMAPDALTDQREQCVALLRDRLYTPPIGASWCFVTNIATPWALAVTSLLMQRTPACVQQGTTLAATVFNAAAHSSNGESTAEARAAAVALYALLTSAPTPTPEAHANDAGHAAAVQTFVALTQSLPALLGSAMYALLSHPEQYVWLRAQSPVPFKQAAHELLRFATPTRAVYRRAVRQTMVGEHTIAAGDLVVLQLAAANRDPARFTSPDSLQLNAVHAPHLAFGAGAHHCSGAAVVHMLLECLLEVLAMTPAPLVLSAPPDVQWMDAAALRAPVRLMVEIGAAR
jgi:cytochrome P450